MSVWRALLLLAGSVAAAVRVSWLPGSGHVSVQCDRQNETLDGLQHEIGPWRSALVVGTVKRVEVRYCVPPAEGYAAALRPLGAALAVTPELHIFNPQPTPPLTDAMFAGLPPVRLNIKKHHESKHTVTLVYPAGPIRLEEPETVLVWCLTHGAELSDAPTPLGRPVRGNTVELRECDAPANGSLGQAFAAIADPSAVISLSLRDMWAIRPLRGTHFSDLNLKLFHLDFNSNERNHRLSGSMMNALSGISELSLGSVQLPPFAAASAVEQASLTGGVTAYGMGGCGALRHLALREWTIPTDANHFLKGCGALQSLILEAVNPGAVPRVLAGATQRLRKLVVTRCELVYLGASLLADAENLEHLDLSDNQLSRIDPMALRAPVALQSLALSRNALGGAALVPALARARLRALRSLSLDDNPLSNRADFCEEYELQNQAEALEELSLQRAGITGLCFGVNWPRLRRLRLAGNSITLLEWTGLPSPRGHRVEVELLQNPLQLASEDERGCGARAPATAALVQANVTVLVDLTLKCDCRYGCAAIILRELRSSQVVGAKCVSGGELANVTAASVQCDLSECGPCQCRQDWSDNTTAAHCEGRELERVPRAVAATVDLTKLMAKGNRLHRLHAEDFPNTLVHVDLRDNGVLRADEAAVRRLFGLPRIFRLGGARVPCTCDALPFLTALHENRLMVLDYEELRCEADSRALGEVDLDMLCDQTVAAWAVLAAVSAPVASVATIVLLYSRYQRHIKVFLFARGWCLWWLQENDLDSERPYDAFVSFCHQDDEFVTEQLLPALEEYRLCIHYRDWAAGGWIPEQIAHSVDTSRRTIIVLSKAFLESQWSLMEFRMAHASTLEEGRARVVVVMLDDVRGDAKVDAELRSYLATNTYLRWGDPWFFDKLRYAMPRHVDAPAAAAAPAPAAALPQLRAAADLYRGTAADTTSQPAVLDITEQSV